MLRYADSPDGARLACEVSGSGPALVCVHGAGAGRWAFELVRPLLEDSFTVVAMDRRGRGDSTDGPTYSLEREVEDLEAVLRDAGEGAYLFCHSYGALIGAAVLARAESGPPRAILYEPPAGGVLATPEQIRAWQAAIDRGDLDGFLSSYLQAVGGYSPAQVEAARGTEAWDRRIACAPPVPREMRAERDYRPDLDALANVTTPTLLLLGSDSPEWASRSTRTYSEALRSVDVHTLDGQGHGALAAAPELLVRELRDFVG